MQYFTPSSHLNTGGGSFELKHSGWGACGIPEAGDTMVLTGGYYVTRWVEGNNNSDDDHDNEYEYFSIND